MGTDHAHDTCECVFTLRTQKEIKRRGVCILVCPQQEKWERSAVARGLAQKKEILITSSVFRGKEFSGMRCLFQSSRITTPTAGCGCRHKVSQYKMSSHLEQRIHVSHRLFVPTSADGNFVRKHPDVKITHSHFGSNHSSSQ